MRIIVIGAGVSGLTCAVRLLQSGFQVNIVTREFSEETTSSVAAALWFPFRAYPLERVIDWSLASLERFSQLEKSEDAGIRTTSVREVYRETPPPPKWREDLPGFSRLSAEDVSEGFEGGYAMRVPVIDSSRYLPFLTRWIERLGGTIDQREVERLAPLRSEADLVVNCSGVGARSLAGDESVFPIRGQVVRVPRGSFDEAIVDEGSAEAAYIVPRTDDCILGTTIDENDWNRTPSDEDTVSIVDRCAQLDPRVRDLDVLDARAGLRPGRPEVRLELEWIDTLPVVHDYGHGGSGFTLSWGCAEEVARRVEAHSRQRTR